MINVHYKYLRRLFSLLLGMSLLRKRMVLFHVYSSALHGG